MALAVQQLPLGPFQTNCYVVRATPAATSAVVIDPSGEAATIIAQLNALAVTCDAILVTHGHFDHIYGLAGLARDTGAPVYAPAGERAAIESPVAPAGLGLRAPERHTADVLLSGGETIDVAGIAFDVVSVPGHSVGHLAYQADGELFSGDVLFAGSVGRTDVAGGDWGTLLASIRTLTDAYAPETVVHPGHGPETTLGTELTSNPFLADLRP